MALKDKLMTLEDFKAVRDVDVASNSAQFTKIKADLGAVAGATPLEMTAGYLTCNTGVGTVVDTDNPTASVNYQYSITPCVEGDEFLVSGKGGNAPRLWCFLDSTKAIISVSEASLTAENLIITAPENSAYCIVNSVDKTKTSYKGVLLSLKVDEISNGVSSVRKDLDALADISVDVDIEWTNKKRIDSSGGVHDAGSTFYMSQRIYIGVAKKAVFAGLSYFTDVDQASVVCYGSSGFIQSYKQNNAFTLDLPDGTTYIRLCHYDVSYRPLANCTMELVYFPVIGEIEDDIVEIGARIDGLPLISLDRNQQKLNLLENLNPADVVQARFITNGVIGSSENTNWTSIKTYIPVVGGTTYGICRSYIPGLIWVNCKIAWYQADKTYISEVLQTNNLGYTAPANAAYCRISMISKAYNAKSGTDDFSEIYMSDYSSGLYVRTINPQYVVQNGYPLTTLFGKKWALFGDSITEARLRASICYHDYIRSECGIDTSNFAVGGAGYKCSDDLNVAIYQRVYQQRETLADYDVITIMAGVNDCTYFGNAMGTIDDVFVGDDYTVETENGVFACVNKTLDLIAEYAPLVRVGVILPLPAVVNNYAYNPADSTNKMSVFVENMKTLLEKRGIPYLDLYHKSGLRPWDNEVNAQFFRCNSDDSPDRLHPNQFGHKFFYPMVREFVKSLI